MTSSSTYTEPACKLLTLGRCESYPDVADYLQEYGLTADCIPELLRLCTDRGLLLAESEEEDERAYWGPIHALRALGQLKAVETVKPILYTLQELELAEFWTEDVPHAIAAVGEGAIPDLKSYLADTSQESYHRTVAAEAFVHMAGQYPELRETCIETLAGQLQHYQQNDLELNGFLIAYLLDLEAADRAPLMQEAFEAERVDIMVAGDWEGVQVVLGLKEKRETPWEPRRQMLQELQDKASKSKELEDVFSLGKSTERKPKSPGFSGSAPTKKSAKKKKKGKKK